MLGVEADANSGNQGSCGSFNAAEGTAIVSWQCNVEGQAILGTVTIGLDGIYVISRRAAKVIAAMIHVNREVVSSRGGGASCDCRCSKQGHINVSSALGSELKERVQGAE